PENLRSPHLSIPVLRHPPAHGVLQQPEEGKPARVPEDHAGSLFLEVEEVEALAQESMVVFVEHGRSPSVKGPDPRRSAMETRTRRPACRRGVGRVSLYAYRLITRQPARRSGSSSWSWRAARGSRAQPLVPRARLSSDVLDFVPAREHPLGLGRGREARDAG